MLGKEQVVRTQSVMVTVESREEMKDFVFLHISGVLGQLSTCPRKAVGAVIVRDGRCISWGFNGAPPGMPHCEENDHGWADVLNTEGPDRRSREERLRVLLVSNGCRNVTHAEANALAFAARQGISTDGGTLFVSLSPCEVCSRLLIAAGIVRVVYAEEYRDPRGVEILREAGVDIG